MNIPDGMPTLAKWNHPSGPESGRACVMELVSVLAGEKWSDWPECTNNGLAAIAQQINDEMSDERRNDLLVIVPDLIHTRASTPDREEELSEALFEEYGRFHEERLGVSLNTFANTYGAELLRRLSKMCDEFNGYDRTQQEPVAEMVEPTLYELAMRAV